MLSALNRDLLFDISGGRLKVVELPRTPIRTARDVAKAFGGYIDGLSDQLLERVIRELEAERSAILFIDGSNLGELARAVKKRLPSVKVFTFCHNVEARFFLGALRSRPSPRSVGVFLVNALAEWKAARFSDEVICLSERDRSLLRRLYGRCRVQVSPMAVREQASAAPSRALNRDSNPYALFVGGPFYANLAGIEWFAREVAPKIGIDVLVVGRGMEAHRAELERWPRIKVIGAVDSLADWYAGAHFVVAPIFDGSGMKTKVAEALMYGKKVVGSPEAFSGYEAVEGDAGWVCRSADEFVAAIERARQLPLATCDAQLRDLFETHYSYRAARARFARFLAPTAQEPRPTATRSQEEGA